MPYRNPLFAGSTDIMGAMFGNPQAELSALSQGANARRAVAAANLDELSYGARTGAGGAFSGGGDVNDVLSAVLSAAAQDPRGLGTVAPNLMSAYGGIPEIAAVLGEEGMSYLANMTGTQQFGGTPTGQGRALDSAETRSRIAAGPGYARVNLDREQWSAEPVTVVGPDGIPATIRRGDFDPALHTIVSPDDIEAAAGLGVLRGTPDPNTDLGTAVLEMAGAGETARGAQNRRTADQEILNVVLNGVSTLARAGDAVDQGASVGFGTGTQAPGGLGLTVGDDDILRATTGALDMPDMDWTDADRRRVTDAVGTLAEQNGITLDPRLAQEVVAEAERRVIASGGTKTPNQAAAEVLSEIVVDTGSREGFLNDVDPSMSLGAPDPLGIR